MKDLIEILPQIIIYIVIGFAFTKTFHFVALRQNNSTIEHALTLSLVVGYIIWSILHMIPISISYEIDTIGMVICAVVVGYLLGRLIRSRGVIEILDWLGIRDTPNVYYWDDLMDEESMKVKVTYADYSYEGMLHHYESYSNCPHVVLACFIKKDAEGRCIVDNRENLQKIIVLDTNNAKEVEIEYYGKSKACKDISQLNESSKCFKEEI